MYSTVVGTYSNVFIQLNSYYPHILNPHHYSYYYRTTGTVFSFMNNHYNLYFITIRKIKIELYITYILLLQ